MNVQNAARPVGVTLGLVVGLEACLLLVAPGATRADPAHARGPEAKKTPAIVSPALDPWAAGRPQAPADAPPATLPAAGPLQWGAPVSKVVPLDAINQELARLKLANGDVIVSDDAKHFAYIVASGLDKKILVIDGKQGPPVESVVLAGVRFNADFSRAVYRATRDGRPCWVMTGLQGATFVDDFYHSGAVAPAKPSGVTGAGEFSSDLTHVVVQLEYGMGRRALRVDPGGPEFGPYHGLFQRALSPDGKHCLFVAERTLFLDGQAVCGAGSAGLQTFSPDGQHYACVVTNPAASAQFVCHDGGLLGPVTDVSSLTFSPDSARLAFVARNPQGGKQSVIIDGVAGDGFDSVLPPRFSRDSKAVVYAAAGQNGSLLIVNGQPGQIKPLAGGLITNVAAGDTARNVAYVVGHNLVVAGERLPFNNDDNARVEEFDFSPKSGHVIWIQRNQVMVDGVPVGVSSIRRGPLVFDGDSKFSYAANGGRDSVLRYEQIEVEIIPRAVVAAGRAAETAGVRQAAKAFRAALLSGDAAAAKKNAVSSEITDEFLDAMAPLTAAQQKYRKAIADKFGVQGGAAPAADATLGAAGGAGNDRIDAAEVTLDGDTAAINVNGGLLGPMAMKKMDGQWKVDLTKQSGLDKVKARLPAMRAAAKVLNETADEVTAGKYKNMREVGLALKRKSRSSPSN